METLITKKLSNGKTVFAYQSEYGILPHIFFTNMAAQKKVDELRSIGVNCHRMHNGRNIMIYILND